jgi:hypothetical protein
MAEQSDLETDSKQASNGSFGGLFGAINPLGILWKFAKAMPDELLEQMADKICDLAAEIRFLRQDEAIMEYETSRIIEDFTVSKAS